VWVFSWDGWDVCYCSCFLVGKPQRNESVKASLGETDLYLLNKEGRAKWVYCKGFGNGM